MTIREQAALICQIRASNPGVVACEAADAIGAGNIPYWLASKAVYAIPWSVPVMPVSERYAEAEAMLRTGWKP